MPMTPMFHVHAWGFPYAATLAGLKQVYPGRYSAEGLARLISKEGVTLSHCVPTVLRMLLDHSGDAEPNLSGLSVVVGGSALTASLAEAATQRGIDVFCGYGMSESCPLLSISLDHDHSASDDVPSHRTKAGQPIPLVYLELMDDNGAFVPKDGIATGEIVARAPWLTESYLGDHAASEMLWEGGYLHTRDIGRLAPDSRLTITDRLKDVIKSGGEWISSLELEEEIGAHPDVAEVCVVGMPDDIWGERAVPVVVRRPGKIVSEAAIITLLSKRVTRGELARLALPRRVIFRTEIPKTSVGKPDKKALRSMLEQPETLA